ncbi:MAG: hypothetical protein E5Y85_21815 [Mesorhizobium sp.]|nr:MAG: hypothetical protein E5Y85_21815 [Mesorhizobium sp.]
MRGAPAWHRQHSVQHPSTVSALRADPPSPTRGEGRGRLTGCLTGLTFRARCLCVAPSSRVRVFSRAPAAKTPRT